MKGRLRAFVLLSALSALPAAAADEIHWTFTGQTSVVFDWRGAETTLSYGTSPSTYTSTVTAITPTPLPTSSAGPFHEATLTGLSENTLYYYRIGSGPEHTFRTPPPRGSSGFPVWVEGDIGSKNSYSRVVPVQNIVAGVFGNGLAPFVLVPGDLTYGDFNGLDDTDQHFNDVMVWSQDAAYMPAWGNHEWQGGSFNDFINNYEGRFGLPNSQTSPGASSASGNGPGEDWYWFDYGNTRFIAYPEPYSGAWSDWSTKADALMDTAQADPQIAFIVTFGHRPAYSSGSTSSNTTLQPILDALGDGHSKYVLDLSGHAHHYERTLPLHGVVHIVVGTGHVAPDVFTTPQAAWTAFRTIQSGALKLQFWASGIEGQLHCAPASSVCYADGGVLDDFTIGAPGDTTPPTVAVTSPAANATVSGTVTVSANASDNSGQVASVQFKLDGQNLGAADTTAPYSVSWNTTGAANGAHTLTAQALDPDGNSATSAPISVTVSNSDTTAPTVTVTAPAAGSTVSGTVTVSATASDNGGQVASVQFKLDGQNLGAPDTTAPYSISWNTTAAANGPHTLSAHATDPTGNVGTSAPIGVTVSNASPDTTPPTASVTAPTAGSTVSGTVAVSASASDDSGQVASVQFKLDGQNLGAPDTTAPYSISWNTTAAANGAHTLSAQATDFAGNVGASAPISVTVSNADTAAPTVAVTAPAAGATVSGTVTVSASASDDSGQVASVQFKLDGQDLGPPDTTAPYSLSWNTTAVANGTHTLGAQATDPAGNSATASISVTVSNDTTPPSVSVTAPAPGAFVNGTVTVSASASDGGGVASVQFKLDGQNLGAPDTTAPYSVSWNTGAVPSGAHTLSAQATDNAGNSATSAAITVTVDHTAPGISITSPAPGATVSFTVTVQATASDTIGQVAGVQFKLDGVNLGAEDTTAPYSITWDTVTAANGAHTLSATARDTVSNSTTVSITVTVDNPVVTFTATADATLKPSSPNSNDGGSSILTADGGPASKHVREFLVKFTVSGLTGHPVVNAKLRLFNTNSSDKGGSFYRCANSSWTENGVTWNNAPAPDPTPIATLGSVSSSKWYEINVTPLITGDGTYTLRVKTTSNDNADYNSKEVAGKAPTLVVTYQP